MPSPSHFAELTAGVAQAGFVVRGGFHAQPEDGLPADVASVVLVGNVGARGFAGFRNSPEWATGPDPMDRYTERVMGAVGRDFGARVVFPQQGPPWWPFQRWAMRAETVFTSPLRILIHPQHGLWHAYRAALLFAARVAGLPAAIEDPARAPAAAAAQSPCAQCSSRACLSGCPAEAFDEHGLDRARCARHLRSAAGRRCLDEGCAARNACPVAPHTRYCAEQRRFHMRAFSSGLLDAVPQHRQESKS